MSLFQTKSIDELIASSEEPAHRLKKSLGPWSLAFLGVGIVIGSGIFTVTGTAAAGKLKDPGLLQATVLDMIMHGQSAAASLGRPGAGPALIVSFLMVLVACLFAGLCFAELASMIPIAGSTYTYAYAILGEIFAWIIGWDLILEYAVANMSVAVGFSAYLQDLGDNIFGIHLPPAIAYPMFAAPGTPAGIYNLPALLITMAVTWVLVRGVRESAEANTAMVFIKIAAIAIFSLGALRAINTANYHPFAPHGLAGIVSGASIVFFTYVGFDAVSTAAEECRRPQRDVPFGIIATLIICTILYGSVSIVLTGIANWQTLDPNSAVAVALKNVGYNRIRLIVSAGALTGMMSSLLVGQYGQARIWFAMSRDRLLPGFFGESTHNVSNPLHRHLDRGAIGRNPVGPVGHRHFRRADEYRHSVRLHHRRRERDRVEKKATRPSPIVPGSTGAAGPDSLDRLLPDSDDGIAAADVDQIFRVARDRDGDLFGVQPPSYGGSVTFEQLTYST